MKPQKPKALILASASPRRRALLAERGFRFEVMEPAVEETNPGHLTVRETVLLNAKAKASAIAALHPDACVVAADTLVALEGRPLGKPQDMAEAHAMLRELAGRTHQVFSGVWVTCGPRAVGFIETSHVRFRTLREPEIKSYASSVHVLDKAGAYAAQEDPIGLIEEITGSKTNVIGLPMEQLERVLGRLIGTS